MKIEYQAKCGTKYYTDVKQIDTHKGRPVYSATVYYKVKRWDFHNGGRYISLGWYSTEQKGVMLEPVHFESGILNIRGNVTINNY